MEPTLTSAHPPGPSVLRVTGLGKEYIRGGAPPSHQSFREMITGLVTSPFQRFRQLSGEVEEENRFWALRDVSFEVRSGEVVGVIGRNGAGKSTLLKIIARITEPTTGKAEVHGRVASLLEIGTGFHHELTGRENIFLSGAILGMTRKEIRRKFEEIVAFAEIDGFLDTPVKRYSSGMFMRLAFSVAAHLEPEILVIDEVLAVGDTAFQQKCLGKMNSIAQAGRTILFVSHNLAAIRSLCSRAILLQNGSISCDDTPDKCITRYLSDGQRNRSQKLNLESCNRAGGTESALRELWLEDESGELISELPSDAPFSICIRFAFTSNIPHPVFQVRFSTIDGYNVGTFSNHFSGEVLDAGAKNGVAELRIESLPFVSADYHLSLSVHDGIFSSVDVIEHAILVQVLPKDIYGTGQIPSTTHGLCYLKGKARIRT
jgi:lipopolysaccharide transport system ATP-binding protein